MKFNEMGLSEPILAVLQQKKIIDPTPIQEQSIPHILQGEDVLGIAKTGTGKTFAFVLPTLQLLVQERATDTATALIITPTRELAFQIEEAIRMFEQATRIHSTVIVGGAPQGKQVQALKRRPQIVVATPGRLQDLLDQKKINLRSTTHVILDEADRMLDMGFAPQINKIFKHLRPPNERQLLLFSATMPNSIIKIVQTMMRNPVHLEVASSGETVEAIHQEVVILEANHRKEALVELLEALPGAVLVFTRTKHQAKKLNEWLRGQGYKSEEIHGNRTLPQRTKAVDAMMKKRSRILVATDIAARGIDIPHIELVVNFFLPDNPEDYIHRIGRTGRAGREGWAVSFVSTDQSEELHAIQRLINMQIDQATLKTVPTAVLAKSTYAKKRGGGGGGRRPQGSRGSRSSDSRNSHSRNSSSSNRRPQRRSGSR